MDPMGIGKFFRTFQADQLPSPDLPGPTGLNLMPHRPTRLCVIETHNVAADLPIAVLHGHQRINGFFLPYTHTIHVWYT